MFFFLEKISREHFTSKVDKTLTTIDSGLSPTMDLGGKY